MFNYSLILSVISVLWSYQLSVFCDQFFSVFCDQLSVPGKSFRGAKLEQRQKFLCSGQFV